MDLRRRASSSSSSTNWKPWQTSPYLLVPLLLAAIVVMGILEYLTQLSQPTLTKQPMREAWLDWYRSSHRVDLEELEALPLEFEDAGSCKRGILNLRHISRGQYFAWIYLPSILAILAAIVWGFIDEEIKRIEPFYQASRPGGARAGSTIFADYISVPSLFSPVQALHRKQWTVLLSALCSVTIGTVTPVLQSRLFQIQVQVIQVGYKHMGNQSDFDPFSSDGRFLNLSRYDERFDSRIYGWCLIAGEDDVYVTIGEMYGIIPHFDIGAIRPVLYLDSSMSRTQEALLLLVLVLGALLTYRLVIRHSGMTTSYGSLASYQPLPQWIPNF